MLMMAPQWWWMTDKYDIDEAFPTVFDGLAGPMAGGTQGIPRPLAIAALLAGGCSGL